MDSLPSEQRGTVQLAVALGELTTLLLATPSVEALLDDVARLAASLTSPPAECGITLRRDRATFTSRTSVLALYVDEVQYAQGSGPGLQALDTGLAVAVADVATEKRWGRYPAHAFGYGLRSSLSLPLSADDGAHGALNLYAMVPYAFGDEQRRLAEMFADQASVALTIVIRAARQVALIEQLRAALAGRSIIDQAVGILMGRQRCSADVAFGALRSASQYRNRRVHDVASDIVRSVGGEEPRASPFRDPS